MEKCDVLDGYVCFVFVYYVEKTTCGVNDAIAFHAIARIKDQAVRDSFLTTKKDKWIAQRSVHRASLSKYEFEIFELAQGLKESFLKTVEINNNAIKTV